MSVLPSLIYTFSAISVKVTASYFVDVEKMTVNFLQRNGSPRKSNTILKEKNKLRELILPEFKTYYKAIEMKTVWDW